MFMSLQGNSAIHSTEMALNECNFMGAEGRVHPFWQMLLDSGFDFNQDLPSICPRSPLCATYEELP